MLSAIDLHKLEEFLVRILNEFEYLQRLDSTIADRVATHLSSGEPLRLTYQEISVAERHINRILEHLKRLKPMQDELKLKLAVLQPDKDLHDRRFELSMRPWSSVNQVRELDRETPPSRPDEEGKSPVEC